MPEAISASTIDDGPTSGTTAIPRGGPRDEERAGIGDSRTPGVGQESQSTPFRAGARSSEQRAGSGADPELDDADLAYRQRGRERLQERTRGLRVLDDVLGEAARDVDRVRRQHALGRDHAEEIGHDIKPPGRRRHSRGGTLMPAVMRARGTATPAARSIVVRRMSGRPISAVGSSLSMLSKSEMPRASERTLPVQS